MRSYYRYILAEIRSFPVFWTDRVDRGVPHRPDTDQTDHSIVHLNFIKSTKSEQTLWFCLVGIGLVGYPPIDSIGPKDTGNEQISTSTCP